ncbi:MAG TPA: hypothetical protein V6C81_01270 [Planktothrix sp.]
MTELAVACVLMTFAFGAVGEMALLLTNASTKMTNCIDGVTGANQFIERVSADVRAGSKLGNSFDTTTSAHIVGTNYPVAFGAPTAAQTLIIQQPALIEPTTATLTDLAGAPLMIPANYFAGGDPAVNVPYIDVVVYQLLADPVSPGQYEVQEVRFSGSVPITGTLLRPAIPYDASNPHVVLRGIVGPLSSAGGLPAIFQQTTNGVNINLELENPIPNNGINVHHVGIHSEAYLKCATNDYNANFIPVPAK